jgi:4-azaleucine resistance transporter AzlC
MPPSPVLRGVKMAVPIMLGYAPIGAAYGLLAQQAGFGMLHALCLSVFVYAGAAQFMAVSLFAAGMGFPVIVGTTFVVNFRHVLMSASLSRFLSSWTKSERVIFGGMITDESFAIHSRNFERGDTATNAALALNTAAYLTWVIFGMIGFHMGTLIKRPEAWGLDFALPAMFIGLLLPACQNAPSVIAAIFGGAVSVTLHLAGAGNWAAFIGAIAGAAAGVCFRRPKP